MFKLFFLLKEGILNFSRARLAAIITVLTIGLSLTILGIFAVGIVNLSNLFNNFYKKVTLEVFLSPAISDSQIQKLKRQILTIPGVAEVIYISPQEALRKFQKDFGADLVGVLDENPLPPSFRVQLQSQFTNVEKVDRIVERIRKLKNVDEVLFQREIVRLVNEYFFIGVLFSLITGIVLFVITTLLIFNTIRLSIHGRKNLIEIMKLVGATPFFIKGPFLFEGILQGIIGALFSGGFLWLLKEIVRSVLFPQFQIPEFIFGSLLVMGMVLGFIGSTISVNKYLRY